MRIISDLEELKRIQLDILLKVHSFCEEHGLRYSLESGTLLAILHLTGCLVTIPHMYKVLSFSNSGKATMK